MTKLIIARHGNTFGPEDTPTRVGARTDLPLVESGLAQAAALGAHLKAQGFVPGRVYCSALQRTQQTAQGALAVMGLDLPLQINRLFNEIDYGPDENQPEDLVIARIGQQALADWDAHAQVPKGWLADPDALIKGWQDFAAHLPDGETVLVVTSNGTARFAPYLTGDFDHFTAHHPIKLKTGAYGVLERQESGNWLCQGWNIRSCPINHKKLAN